MVGEDDVTVVYAGPVPADPPYTAVRTTTAPQLVLPAQPMPLHEVRGAGLFRPEAEAAYRAGAGHGAPLRIVPTWMVWSVRIIVLAVLAAVAFAAVAEVRDHARGPAVIRVDGRRIVGAPTTGTITAIEVRPGQRVEPGQVLVRFDDGSQRADLERIEREHELLLARLLRAPTDAGLREQLAGLAAQEQLARARLDERTVVAPEAGVASDVRVHVGQHVEPGNALLAIDGDDSQVVVVGLLPGHQRPRLHGEGRRVDLELDGFGRERIPVRLRTIADEVVGPAEALRFLGEDQAGAIELRGPVVVVEAVLDGPTFEAEGETYRLYDGMQGSLEAELESTTLLKALLPDLDGVLP